MEALLQCPSAEMRIGPKAEAQKIAKRLFDKCFVIFNVEALLCWRQVAELLL